MNNYYQNKEFEQDKKVKIIIKRLIDLGLAALALILLSPLIGLTAISIRITMGKPIFFQQPRLGYKGKPFVIYKFRTMTNDKDQEDNFLPDEQRLTKLGKLLRITTLDEAPELFNILKGEMSAVGPRPLLVEYRDLYTAEQWRRHDMPPGMAGPVISSGRNTLTWEEKFEHDIWYVENWSFWLDMKIIFKTALQVIKREGISQPGHVTMEEFRGTESDND